MTERPRDEGAMLPLVLVMMVIAALVVVPLLSYSVSVLKANKVVGEATRHREAAEAGLRVALLDPTGLFNQCAGSPKPVPGPAGGVIDGIAVSTTCSMTEEVGPLNVLGFRNPVGTTATQLGATVPQSFIGTASRQPESGAHDWWVSTPTATDGQIWMPTLPAQPQTVRTGPFDMPPAFQCTVYLPGRYPDPLTITTGNVYFASGVYWFEDEVTFSGDANVVIGYGLAELPTECADDIQVGANLLGSPGVFDIDGAGATWVFGANGRLVIDNSATSAGLSVRFNQRYVEPGFEADRGQRISIMSVNGDDDTAGPHDAPGVVHVPRSMATVNQVAVPLGQPGAEYQPTSSRFTAEPVAPAAPGNPVGTPHRAPATSPTPRGVVLLEWDEVTGPAAGGALIDSYEVTWTSAPTGPATPTPVCEPHEIVSPAPGRLACVVTGLTNNRTYSFSITATNAAGTSPAAVATVELTGSPSELAAPDAPAVAGFTPYDDAVEVTWTPGASDGGAPITGYTVVVQRVTNVPAPTGDDDDGDDDSGDDDDDDDDDDDAPPVLIEQYETVGTCSTGVAGWQAAPTTCIATVTDDGAPNIGYRFIVTATNAIGVSPETIVMPDPAVLTFDGPPVPAPADPPVRVVEPRLPDPIVDLRLAGNGPTTVSIPGYVSVPMSRVSVDNPHAHDVRIIGGMLAGTFHVDAPTAAAPPESVMLGYQSEIVLQRRVTLVSTASNVVARAVVQINEDGNFAVNSWVVQ